jgi:hypothetical protein
MAVDELKGVIETKGKATGQQFVEGHPEGIKVRAVIHYPVHPASLLW